MGKTRRSRPVSGIRGFTLIEITIAVLILSIALVTILGLQSSIIQRTLRDEGKQQAMLIARSILSAIETQRGKIDIQDKVMPAEELLKTFVAVSSTEDDEERNRLLKYMARISVEVWGIPRVDDAAMKRIRLSIFQENDPEDSFEVVFFIPNQDEFEEDEEVG